MVAEQLVRADRAIAYMRIGSTLMVIATAATSLLAHASDETKQPKTLVQCDHSVTSWFNVPQGGTNGGSEIIGEGPATMRIFAADDGRSWARIERRRVDGLPRIFELEITSLDRLHGAEIDDWLTDRNGRTEFVSGAEHDIVGADLKDRPFDKVFVVVDNSRFSGSGLAEITVSASIGSVQVDAFNAQFQGCETR